MVGILDAVVPTFRGSGGESQTVRSLLKNGRWPHIFDYIPAAQHAAILDRSTSYDCIGDFEDAIADVSYGVSGSVNVHGPKLILPPGKLKWSRPLVLKKTISLLGSGSGEMSDARGTQIEVSADQHGIIVHRFDTFGSGGEWASAWASGQTVTVGEHRNSTSGGGLGIYECTIQGGGTTANRPIHSSGAVTGADGYQWTYVAPATGADGSQFSNFTLVSLQGSSGHGIWARARFTAFHVGMVNFPGDGYHIVATASSTSANRGNANNFRIYGGRITTCQNGCFIDGADANQGTIIGLDTSTNRQWGRWDSSFLGCQHYGCHTSGNGTAGYCSHNSVRYVLVDQAGRANEPGADGGLYWWPQGAGGVSASYPAWTAENTLLEGGSFKTDSDNAYANAYGEYSEGGQPVLIAARTYIFGGTITLSELAAASTGKMFSVNVTRLPLGKVVASGETMSLTWFPSGTNEFLYEFDHPDWMDDPLRLGTDTTNGGLYLRSANTDGQRTFLQTLQNTVVTFGRSAAVPHAMFVDRLFVGSSLTNGRQITNGTAAPSSSAWGVGDVCFNRTPASGQPMGWMCTVAGTPGTWVAMANLA